MSQTKKYVIAEQPDNSNESDTKIRIKLFPVSSSLNAAVNRTQQLPSSSSSELDEQEEGEIISNPPNQLSMNIEEDSSEYHEEQVGGQ